MKLTITCANLQEAVTAVTAAVPARTTLPVLSNVLVEASGDRVRFSGTDLDITVRIERPAEIETEGSITVPAKKLSQLAKELPAGAVVLESRGGELKVTSGRTKVKLNGMAAEEFPEIPGVDFDAGFELGADTLRELISRSTYAVSTEESRPILNGVYWQILEDEMRMVATNGHRLAKNVVATDGPDAETAAMIVPPAALTQLDRMLGDAVRVTVARNENFLGFRAGPLEVLTRLIEGPYPNYEQVIPKSNDKSLVVDRAGFEQIIRRMNVVANEQTHRVFLNMRPGSVAFRVESPDTGSAEDEIAATYEGEPLEIAFNAAYLTETVRKIPTDFVRLTFSTGERAVMVMPEGLDEGAPKFEALIMPLRVEA